MERQRRSKFYSTRETTTIEFRKGNDSAKPLQVTYEPNIESSLSTTRVRQRLCDLMGTDVIRLNDKRYFQKLSQRLQDEYEVVMDKAEAQRASKENERLRRLMLEGVIEAPDDYRAIVHGEHKRRTAAAKPKKQRKIKRRIRITESQEGHDTEQAHSTTSRSVDEENTSVGSKEDVRTQVELLADSQQENTDAVDAESQPAAKSPPISILKKKQENKENKETAQRTREMHVRPPHHDARNPSSCSNHRKSRRVQSAAPRLRHERENLHDDSNEDVDERQYDTVSLPDRDSSGRYSKFSRHEPECIRRLRKEQTVAGLYSIAEELVSTGRTDDESQRKVNMTVKVT